MDYNSACFKRPAGLADDSVSKYGLPFIKKNKDITKRYVLKKTNPYRRDTGWFFIIDSAGLFSYTGGTRRQTARGTSALLNG